VLTEKKIMLVVPAKDENMIKSTRNIPNFNLQIADNANAYDLMNSDVLLFTRTSVERVKEFFKDEK
jgi:large subunit ribosomal protein L4